MFMQYHGGGIGHQLPHNTTDLMEKNTDWENILDDEDSEVVDDREPNRDVDKNNKTDVTPRNGFELVHGFSYEFRNIQCLHYSTTQIHVLQFIIKSV